MKSYKALLNSLSDDSSLRQLTNEEVVKLRTAFLGAFRDLVACCDQHHLTVMLIGGSVIGAVRHQGFIPWDDDLDIAMPRADFEKLKSIFNKELGEKYILSSPNYQDNAANRFPMMLVKDVLVPNGKREALRHHLIRNEIYCPIHWPVSGYHELNERTGYIYQNELSLICDQRYSVKDMNRIIETIKTFWKGA